MKMAGGGTASVLRTRLSRSWFGLLDRMANGSTRAEASPDIRGPSLRSKVMLVVLMTTCLALLLSASALLLYELRAYRVSRLNDLQTQADIIAKATAPALSFKDAKVATENLHMLQLRPQITAAAVYLGNGSLFASYLQPKVEQENLPASATRTGHTITGDKLELFHPIRQNGELLGVLYMRADDDIAGRLSDYVFILLAVMAASTAVAALVTSRLQRALTEPILQMAQVARDVMVHRNFSLRAPKTSSDEVGQLVEAFNDMLTEVEARTTALEETNRHLSVEMAERRKAEEALKETARKKDAFLATLAHELRNPLAPISNAVEIIRRVGDNDTPLRNRALDIMNRQLRQMVRLIDDLLDVSRITTGKLMLQKERTDLIQILHSALEIASPMIEARHHILDVRLPEQTVHVDADPTRLAQVFANLLNNAAKYTSDGGLISLRLRVQGDEAEISVQDNGIGIPPTMQKAVFDMFVQVDQSIDRGRAGLGVGLSLARELTNLHGGSIRLSSEGTRRGTEFIVRLPLSAVQENDAGEIHNDVAHDQAEHSLRVLVADDNVDFAVSLAHILTSLGHQVSTAHDGQSAINLAAEVRPQVIFLDIGMPGMTGHEVAHQLRRQAETRDALLVAVTGWSQDKDRERSRIAGITHHLTKPIDVKQLLPILESVPIRAAA
jgi:signal transduction histidine kinase/ActR/RegA family two-component response regulator